MNKKTLTIIGLVGSGLGFLASIISTYASDKKTELEIEEKVNERVDAVLKERETGK